MSVTDVRRTERNRRARAEEYEETQVSFGKSVTRRNSVGAEAAEGGRREGATDDTFCILAAPRRRFAGHLPFPLLRM